ncbi:MAG TPA: tetratricopeptide repeat protein [Candidatus Obscuribacterales bacterium]
MIYGYVLLVKVLFLAEQGRLDEAEELYPQAMQIVAMTRGRQHPRVEEAMSIFKELESADQESGTDRTRKIETARDSSRHGIL